MMPSTIQECIDQDYDIHVYCEGRLCTHGGRIDLNALGDRLGFDHGCMHVDLERKFKCPKCGSKKVSFRITPYASRQQGIETAWSGRR